MSNENLGASHLDVLLFTIFGEFYVNVAGMVLKRLKYIIIAVAGLVMVSLLLIVIDGPEKAVL